ncbi:PREDICTED: protein FD-like [Nelumbo nucifera]|uniref:BZIP domain-containing protein n=2 Tax=Nelumbo nucifera TaxID=4432 RepID=A0A822YI16_NELNU|nr:PREDICTED: protein FD-like [Nelumbo nucifera]DAD29088.1 TPA_asm: hypothetical protein HUJ06_030556 [Nelumbo nucifera]
MEEVWKDINLTSLNDHHAAVAATGTRESTLPKVSNTDTTNFRGMIFQDFLARPFNTIDPPTSIVSVNPTTSSDVTTFTSPPPRPPTVLSLNSGPEFHYLDNTDSLRPHLQLYGSGNATATPLFLPSLNAPFDSFGSSSAFSPFCQKRVPDTNENSGDRWQKRMLKNRESAARSRARKQEFIFSISSSQSTLLFVSR